LGNRLTELATQDQLVRMATLIATQEQVMELADAVKEMNRLQQKNNLLGESKDQQLESVVSTLQEIVTRREQVQKQQAQYNHERQESIKRLGRGEFATDLLPALDGLELSLARGEAILARQRRDLATLTHGVLPREDDKTAAAAGLLDRLRPKRGPEEEMGVQSHQPARLPESMLATTQAMQEWLYQVKLVHDRFHALLSAEGVEPVVTARQTFDPHLHIAVDTEARSDVPPNTIVREIRKGYRQNNRVLRYAEVVVARSPEGET
jgi:molecular chaperone GrpE (heat shock protein)